MPESKQQPNNARWRWLIVVAVLPGTPKDLLSYYAGLTDIDLLPWLLICSLGRLPSIITSTVGGDALGTQNYRTAILVFAVTLAISAGGLCNLGNTIHLLILHSPLTITEFHKHSDALAPDEGKRVPFSAGTSVCYNHIDYRFKNTTDQDVQLLVWCEGEMLYAELRSERPFPYRYEIVEEDHHFAKEGTKFYRNSKIYRNIIDQKTNEIIEKELILDNHSEVLFDYSLIPEELIRA